MQAQAWLGTMIVIQRGLIVVNRLQDRRDAELGHVLVHRPSQVRRPVLNLLVLDRVQLHDRRAGLALRRTARLPSPCQFIVVLR